MLMTMTMTTPMTNGNKSNNFIAGPIGCVCSKMVWDGDDNDYCQYDDDYNDDDDDLRYNSSAGPIVGLFIQV